MACRLLVPNFYLDILNLLGKLCIHHLLTKSSCQRRKGKEHWLDQDILNQLGIMNMLFGLPGLNIQIVHYKSMVLM